MSTRAAQRPARVRAAAAAPPIETRSPNKPAYRRWVDGEKYAVMRKALLAFFPTRAPGKTQAAMQTVARKVDAKLFPGTTSAWWSKCVQLDLEAKGELVRDRTRPLTWRRVR